MAAHAFFAPDTSLTAPFYARGIDVEDRCSKFPTRTRISVDLRFPPRVWVESEKGCPRPVSLVFSGCTAEAGTSPQKVISPFEEPTLSSVPHLWEVNFSQAARGSLYQVGQGDETS